MREFVYFSKDAVTTGNFDDLKSAGRLDIACHSIIQTFFVSNAIRRNTKLHLFFYGQPNPPVHIEIWSEKDGEEPPISKKDIGGLLERVLYQVNEDKKVEALPCCFVEKKSIIEFIEDLKENDRNIFLLDEKGENIRDVENIGEDPVFVLADENGFPKSEHRRIRNNSKRVSLGDVTYFASQSIVITNNELDYRSIY